MHIQREDFGGHGGLIEPLSALFKAFEAKDPPPDCQAAVTPDLLRAMDGLACKSGEVAEHTSDLTIGAYFFAMRSCEFVWTRKRGRTRLLTLGNVTFRAANKQLISPRDPELESRAAYVTICFVDQKNGKKREKRTQGRSGKSRFCPVLAWIRVVTRLLRHFPDANQDITVCSLKDHTSGERVQIASERVAQLLKTTCRITGGLKKYGFGPEHLGTRSIRSGAAMALFIMDHSVEKIKILGRWSSDAFLVYIRPQVLEWTSIMASDMAQIKGFLDLSYGPNKDRERGDWRDLGLMPSFSRRKR